MFTLLTTVHVLIAVVLILAVLLQSARGTDLAGAFGGMGSQTAFGPRGAQTLLTKATAYAAIGFMITSLSLAILASKPSSGVSSVLDNAAKSKAADKKPASLPSTTPPAMPPQAPAKK